MDQGRNDGGIGERGRAQFFRGGVVAGESQQISFRNPRVQLQNDRLQRLSQGCLQRESVDGCLRTKTAAIGVCAFSVLCEVQFQFSQVEKLRGRCH